MVDFPINYLVTHNIIMLTHAHAHTTTHTVAKTHDSESRGQEEAGRTQQTSELFTHSTAMKFVDTLNKPPLKLSLSYLGLSIFQL